MFSYEERIRAVELLIQYDMSYSTTIRELGYPSQRALRNWYSEYSLNGDLHKGIITEAKYTEDDKRRAVDYYLKHGKCVSRTVKKLGYPSRPTLDKWISQLAPGEKKHCRQGGITIKYSHEQKKQAVISLCLRNGPAKKIADEHGASRESLYRWKKQLLKEEHACFMAKEKTIRPGKVSEDKSEVIKLSAEKEDLLSKVDQLKKEIHRLKIERDIYEKAAELIKKDQGVSIQTLTNCEKAIIINALRGSHQLKELLKIIKMAKSSYHYQVLALKTDKYAELRAMIKKIFEDSHERYGYRRIHFLIKSMGTRVSEKVVRRIMKEEKLSVIYNKRRRYSSYKGEISPEVENKLNRDFQADKPNIKWLTDITELSIPAGKVYLSPIIDCFDGLPVSWGISTSPDAELVNTMLDDAVTTLSEEEHPTVHSDRGCHYRWPGWIERMDRAGLTRSMSKKGYSPDNAACEGFFGRLKNEMFYYRSWKDVTLEKFIEEINEYMKWYASERIKLSLGGLSPIDYRRSLGLLV